MDGGDEDNRFRSSGAIDDIFAKSGRVVLGGMRMVAMMIYLFI